METMKRARLVSLKNIQIETVEKPKPKRGEVLIRVRKCGVCGSDISAFYGKHTYIHFPIVLGHEFSGDIAEVGEGVNNVAVGDRVTVLPHVGCGKCDACRQEKYNLCNDLIVIGCQTTGAYAEYVIAPAKVTFKLPDEMTYEQGACVEPSSVGYHGVKRGVKKGDVVVVMGAGTIGFFATQGANAVGASKTIVCDFNRERLEMASRFGASAVVNLGKESLKEGLTRILGSTVPVDCFMDCVGFDGSAMKDIISVARRGATVVSIGIIAKEFNIPNIPDLTEHELNVLGSSMFWPQDFADVIRLISEGKIKVDGIISHRYKIADIKEMFEMVDKHKENFMKIMLDIDFN